MSASASMLWQLGQGLAAAVVVASLLIFIVLPCISRVVGKAVKTLLQSIDKKILGVNVKFGHLHVNPFCLKVRIDGLTVENPEGYSSPFLLKMDDVHVNVGLRKLLFSCGRRVSVQQLDIDGVEVNLEKTLTTSNVHDVLSYLGRKATPDPQERERMDRTSDSDDLEYAAADKQKHKMKANTKVEIHAVVVHGISVTLQAWMFKMKLKAADMDFQDLTEDIRGHETSVVAQLLLESLLMSVLANVPAGDNVQQAWDRRKRRTASDESGSDSEASTYSLFSSCSGSGSDGEPTSPWSPCICCR